MSTTPEILPRTFIHIPGIGPTTEKVLWKRGITSWNKFLRATQHEARLTASRNTAQRLVEGSIDAFQKRRIEFFARYLPRDEWWRLYRSFESKAVFLDIETTGLSHYYDEVTVVGLYDGKTVKTLIAGHDLHKLPEHLEPYDVMITFNGTLFDIPFLRTKFRGLPLPSIHLDLRFLLRRLGHTGGLKEIERKLGIKRSKLAEGIDGLMATVLWARYLRGDLSALEQLVQYNADDITSLHSLMRYCYSHLASNLLSAQSRFASPRKPQPPKRVSVQIQRVNGSSHRLVLNGRRYGFSLPQAERSSATVYHLLEKIGSSVGPARVVGIDLRASEERPTGWAFLRGEMADTQLVKTDEEIIEETVKHDPLVISIDSPLGIPLGRCCTSDACSCREKGILRECERILWRRGVRVYPCLLPSMQKLTERGIRLAMAFRQRGYKVIESYPGAAQDIMRIPRKRSSLEELARGLRDFGLTGAFLDREVSHDELDAITSAVVGYFHLSGDYEALGEMSEEQLVVPTIERGLERRALRE